MQAPASPLTTSPKTSLLPYSHTPLILHHLPALARYPTKPNTHITIRRPPELGHQPTVIIDNLHTPPDLRQDLFVRQRRVVHVRPGVHGQMTARVDDLLELRRANEGREGQ